jgi:hypothetical protein
MSNDNADKRRAARGGLPWQEGDEPAEATIRRIRGGDTERIAALEAEIARLRAERDDARRLVDQKRNLIIALIELKNELRAENDRLRAQLALYQDDERGFKRLEGGGQQATFTDGPASEDYPGELSSDAPYKCELRDGRGGWGPW